MTVGPATRAVADVAARVAGPLVVAVAGRVKAGKSTLVNALLGRAVAPTDIAECTRVVTRFRHGPVERVVVVGRDGTRHALPLDPVAGLPTTLPFSVELVDHLQVELATEALRDLELVDTPGLSTVRAENAERTEAFLGLDPDSARAAAGADALVFLLNQAVRADDADALRAFLRACGDRSGVATVAVLNKADQITGGLGAARELAARHAVALAGLAGTVVPLAGLHAAAVRCGHFREDDAAAIAALAALPGEERATLLADVELLCTLDAPVPTEQRRHLAGTLALTGVAAAVDAARNGNRTAAGIGGVLLALSGFGPLQQAIDRVRRRADAIKTRAALAALERLAYDPTTPATDAATLQDLGAYLRLRPELHCLDELGVLDDLARGTVVFPGAEAVEADRIFAPGAPAERLGVLPGASEGQLAAIAWDRAVHWQARTNDSASPRQRHAARVVQRSYLLLWERLSGPTGRGAQVPAGAAR